jgi:hypothetical protein
MPAAKPIAISVSRRPISSLDRAFHAASSLHHTFVPPSATSGNPPVPRRAGYVAADYGASRRPGGPGLLAQARPPRQIAAHRSCTNIWIEGMLQALKRIDQLCTSQPGAATHG